MLVSYLITYIRMRIKKPDGTMTEECDPEKLEKARANFYKFDGKI